MAQAATYLQLGCPQLGMNDFSRFQQLSEFLPTLVYIQDKFDVFHQDGCLVSVLFSFLSCEFFDLSAKNKGLS